MTETLAALFAKLIFQLIGISFSVGSIIEINALSQKEGENLIQHIYIYRGRLGKSFFL